MSCTRQQRRSHAAAGRQPGPSLQQAVGTAASAESQPDSQLGASRRGSNAQKPWQHSHAPLGHAEAQQAERDHCDSCQEASADCSRVGSGVANSTAQENDTHGSRSEAGAGNLKSRGPEAQLQQPVSGHRYAAAASDFRAQDQGSSVCSRLCTPMRHQLPSSRSVCLS